MFLFLGAACYLFIRAIAQSLRSHAEKACKGTIMTKYFLKKMIFFLQNLFITIVIKKGGKERFNLFFSLLL